MDELQREIEELEGQLTPGRTVQELATVRRGLTDGCVRKPAFELPNLRLGFACKQRWEDMVGDDRVRACNGCDRPVFNLSEMTRAEAERVLATRGLTPCVRFYRRPDGTVMTTDCPTGERRERRRLAVVASSIAAGTALVSPAMRAEPAPDPDVTTPDPTPVEMGQGITIEPEIQMGLPPPTRTFEATLGMGIVAPQPEMGEVEMGIMIVTERTRSRFEWSIWGRLGMGVAAQHPNILARGLTPPDLGPSTMWEAAAATDLTVGLTHDGNIRLGAWGELRTTSGPVAGGELVIEGLPPHPYDSRIHGEGSVVLRAGGNGHVITGAIGFGYIGSRSRSDPWIGWLDHAVGGRIVVSTNHSLDDPRDWSVTLGLEVEPIGLLHSVVDLATGDD